MHAPRRHRPMMAAGVIAALIALVSAKPYLGLSRHSWDPAVLGVSLVALSLYFKRLLDAGSGGQIAGWTAKPLIVGRGDGPDLAPLLAAVTASGAQAGGGTHVEKGFTGQGGSSGGAGAGGTF